MEIAFGSDHAGVELKTHVTRSLDGRSFTFHDFGPTDDTPVDYPDYVARVAQGVASGRFDRGILICGTGVGMAIAANKVPGIRAASVHDTHAARLCREHNDANVLTLGARTLSAEQALSIVQTFLQTPFEGGRHQRRVDKIHAIEAPS